MLLAAIDEKHKGTYDFFYLPIDFKVKYHFLSALGKVFPALQFFI
jgi:RNA recognition motif 2